VDLTTQEILTVALTGNGEDDAAAGSRMLQGHAHGIKSFKGDGAYDKPGFREILGGDVQQVIPPPKNAAVRLPKKEAPCLLIRFNTMRRSGIYSRTGCKTLKIHFLRYTLAGYKFYTYFCAGLLTVLHIRFFTFISQ
jgi:hypothetical protein